jgi:prepilin-type N-terminal cleavage/methylation domain-containing protein
MKLKRPIKRARNDAGFTLMESLVALVIFSAAILSFERAVAGAWRGINAANMKTGAVTLALRLLDETGANSEPETEGQSGRYEWRRRVAIVDNGSASPTKGADDVATFWVEVKVAWLDGASRSAQTVHYRLLKTARRPS